MPNRTVCDVLTDIRKCHETHNYSYLPGLVEEVQSMAYRMEAALWDQKDVKRLKRDLQAAIKEFPDKDKPSFRRLLDD